MMKTAAAVQRGTSHVLCDTPCQDFAAVTSQPPCAAAVLCDGAGSRAHSERAAQCLCTWAVRWIPAEFDALYALPAQDAAEQILRAGYAQLAQLGMTMDECLCTFLAFARHQDGRWLMAHIGDGYLFAPDRVLSYPENGMYANETYFFSGPHAAEHLRVQKGQTDRETAVLLTSDGCGDALYDRQADAPTSAVEKLCRGLSVHTEQEAQQALACNLSEVFAGRSDDDLSLALLWAAPPETACETFPNETPKVVLL